MHRYLVALSALCLTVTSAAALSSLPPQRCFTPVSQHSIQPRTLNPQRFAPRHMQSHTPARQSLSARSLQPSTISTVRPQPHSPRPHAVQPHKPIVRTPGTNSFHF